MAVDAAELAAVFSMNGDRSRVASINSPLPSPADQASEITRLSRVWLADITCIATGEGWSYLAAVLDLATRKVVGGRCAIICAPSFP